MTLQQLQTTIFDFLEGEGLMQFVEDSHAKPSQLLANVEDSMTLEELCSSRLQGSPNKSHDQGRTFGTILNTLDELGYDAEWQVLNSKDFGVPQNRERVFIIGHLRGTSGREVFPIIGQGNEHSTLGKSTKTAVARTFTAGGHSAGNHSGMTIIKENTVFQKTHGATTTVKQDETGTLQAARLDKVPMVVRPVLTPDRAEKRQNGRRIKDDGGPAFTLTAQDRHGVLIEDKPKLVGGVGEINFGKQFRQGNRVYDAAAPAMCLNAQPVGNAGGNSYLYKVGYRIRKLTPKECWRLQGFPDSAFEKAAEVNSDSQLYKQAGNSVTVNVIYEVAKRLS